MPSKQSPVGSTPPPTPEEKGKTLEQDLMEHDKKVLTEVSEIRVGYSTVNKLLMERDAIHSKHHARIEGEKEDLRSTLETLLAHYVDLVNSGDAGSWDPENEEEVIQARQILAKHTTPSPTGKV